jgi:hypothetical protein
MSFSFRTMHFHSNPVRNCFALGIVADSPEGGGRRAQGAAERPEGAPDRDYVPTVFRPRTMSGKPDGELASRNAQKNKIILKAVFKLFN